MKGYLIYPATTPRKNNAFGWFQDAAAHNGIYLEVYFYNAPGMTAELESLPLPDFVFLRGYNTILSSWYESKGVRVINSTASMILCRDKYLAGMAMKRCGVPVPMTIAEEDLQAVSALRKIDVFSNFSEAYEAISNAMSCQTFIMKQRFGSKGENVYLVENVQDFEKAYLQCRLTENSRQSQCGKDAELGVDSEEIALGSKLIFQEYISFSKGRDMRVWVFAGKVIGNILRYNDNSFKSNFAQGGAFRSEPLSSQAALVAINAAAAVGLDFAGVDLLFLPDGRVTVCEVNGNPGFRTAGVDIPGRIFERVGEII